MTARVEIPQLPAWLAIFPLLATSRRPDDRDSQLQLALAVAAAALESDGERRDSRSRLCFLLCELASQFGRRHGDPTQPIGVTLPQLARAGRISLPRVRRIVAFLGLAGVLEATSDAVRVLDWDQLCKLGKFDRSWTMAPVPEEEEDLSFVAQGMDENLAGPRLTAGGEPACFS